MKFKYLTGLVLTFSIIAASECTHEDHQAMNGEGIIINEDINNSTHGIASKELSIRVDGSSLKNQRNEIIQLRGVSIMGMEYVAINGYTISGRKDNDPFPNVFESIWTALHRWHINSLRIPLNEVSYLGIRCVTEYTGPAYGKPGIVQESDPWHNYRSRLREVINRATMEGLYIIIDLHWSAPDDPQNKVDSVTTQCPTDFNPLPDISHAIDFWKAVATDYKDYPNVIFELFNNPYIDQWRHFSGNEISAWQAFRDGTLVNSYLPLWPTIKNHNWQSAGIQQLVDAVRSTGATNVVLAGGLARSSNLDSWLTYKPSDPLNQLAAAWHAFPSTGSTWGDKCYSYPGIWCDDRAYSYAAAIISANYPVIVTEFADRNASGTIGAPFASALLPRLDAMGISYLGWTFVAATQDYILIKDDLGTPTDGYGEYVKAHYTCRAQEKPKCTEVEKSIGPSSKTLLPQSSPSTSGGGMPSVLPI